MTPAGDTPLLPEDRYFDPDPTVRRIARALYDETRDLPIIAPHGHVDPRILAEDEPFPEPNDLIVVPDHYILRMLYSQGIPMESLGVRRRDGSEARADPRKAWRILAEHLHLFRGTPTAAWLGYELHEVFGVRARLDADTADRIYDELLEKLGSPEFRPRALFERFGIEVLTTTDAASDSLEHHRRIAESDWGGRVVPCFRPDAVFQIGRPDWRQSLSSLASAWGRPIPGYGEFLEALVSRRETFRETGATSTDHGVLEPFTFARAPEEMEGLFRKAVQGSATVEDQRHFEAGMLMEMARMSTEDGLVMQLHAGALRDHNRVLRDRFGPDMGGDIPVRTEYTRNLRPLLNAYGSDPRLTLILFTLDESTYSRELAPLAGHYPAVRLGPPWWFHDSIEGMIRFRRSTTETAGIYNTVGFNDDTRAFCSIPARHDLSRRVDANYLAGLVAHHVLDMADARAMARALAYDLARTAYKLA
jgi:glucuronate isomerase